MLFSYVDKNDPFVLSPESLDWYLSRGWYRMGGHIFTTHFLFFQDRPFSAIWIRQGLNTHKFSKSQRKLMRKNAKLFDLAIGPRVIDEEREELYTRYSANFNGRLSPTISDSLEDYENHNGIFNTWETTIRDKVSGKLVGVSYFDLGDTSAASILGIYDPLLSSFSLGYYTMLLEMEFCREQGLEYYYPGYVVPGYSEDNYQRSPRCYTPTERRVPDFTSIRSSRQSCMTRTRTTTWPRRTLFPWAGIPTIRC